MWLSTGKEIVKNVKGLFLGARLANMTVRRRLPFALLAPISLLVLVVALGALQYRWVGQVSEAEREQMKQSLDRRSKEFADDFDREIGRAYKLFLSAADPAPAHAERFSKQYDQCQW